MAALCQVGSCCFLLLTVALFSMMVYLQGIASFQQMSFSIRCVASAARIFSVRSLQACSSFLLLWLSGMRGLPQLNCRWCRALTLYTYCIALSSNTLKLVTSSSDILQVNLSSGHLFCLVIKHYSTLLFYSFYLFIYFF